MIIVTPNLNNKEFFMKTVLVYSGGLDSTILLHKLINDGHQVKCLSFNYGQKHIKELECAKFFTTKLKIEHKIIDLSSLKQIYTKNSLVSENLVPEGHYACESMKKTVVPNRNMIMMSIAVAWAINEEYENVAYAAHKGDHAIYPDCRQIFVDKFADCVKFADWHSVNIISSFVDLDKTEIVKLGNSLDVEMQKTWSCYNGREKHCGKCGTCFERIEAFESAKITDKTEYEK